MGSSGWLIERTTRVLAEDWASIRGCEIGDIEQADSDFRLICKIVFIFFALAIFVAVGLPILFELSNITALVISVALFVLVGVISLIKAPSLHLQFARDAAELENSLRSVHPFCRKTKSWAEKELRYLARHIIDNQIASDALGPNSDRRQFDAYLKDCRAKFKRLYAATSKFWRMESEDLYMSTSSLKEYCDE